MKCVQKISKDYRQRLAHPTVFNWALRRNKIMYDQHIISTAQHYATTIRVACRFRDHNTIDNLAQILVDCVHAAREGGAENSLI